jgi:hypothetical protein
VTETVDEARRSGRSVDRACGGRSWWAPRRLVARGGFCRDITPRFQLRHPSVGQPKVGGVGHGLRFVAVVAARRGRARINRCEQLTE